MIRLDLPKNRTRAPEFPREFAWVNTDRPLYLREALKGNVVVLDFWTYCCINCMHVLPDLEFIEHKYAGEPVMVIGVHSAKFDNEGDRRNIESACARYDIAHPVIVDEAHRIWSEYGVRAWPTLVVIDSEGKVVGTLSGEGNRSTLDAVVHTLLEEGKEKGTLATAPPTFNRTGRIPARSGLAFPGKVLAARDRVFISDSNHNRVIISDTGGNVIAIAGSGRKGQQDGPFAGAEFDNPQGLAFDASANLLYVADTDNHLIRRLDLSGRTVETISGTGEQVYDRVGGGVGRAQGLNSPWDLALYEGQLYIAMAGPHQLWRLDLVTLKAEVWVGSGIEDLQDGTGTRAALAQPSGLTIKGEWLYFADSEVSAIRRANLKTREVQTLVGTGLFDFGDRDGGFGQALLQHPLGVAAYGDDILVADTYNHKIRRLSESRREVSTLVGEGRIPNAASVEGALTLYEPGGLSVFGDTLYIADTNHDRIVVLDLKTHNWREFALRGLHSRMAERMTVNDLPVVEVNYVPGQDLALRLTPRFPKGIHLNRDAPINFTVMDTDDKNASPIEGLAASGSLPVKVVVPDSLLRAGATLQITLSLAYCTDGNQSLCVPFTLGWRLILKPSAAPGGAIELAADVKTVNP